jgi:hypothetical protein
LREERKTILVYLLMEGERERNRQLTGEVDKKRKQFFIIGGNIPFEYITLYFHLIRMTGSLSSPRKAF